MTEPVTTLTDYLLGGCLLVWGIRLWRSARERGTTARRWWAASFLAAALAALIGGTVHGFQLQLGAAGETLLWKVTLYVIGLFSLCVVATALWTTAPARARRPLLAAAVALFTLYAWWLLDHDDFLYAILAYAPSMLLIAVTQLAQSRVRPQPSARWILAGVAVSFAAAAIQRMDLRLGPHVNHNDVYHVVQIFGGYLLYRGGLLLRDRIGYGASTQEDRRGEARLKRRDRGSDDTSRSGSAPAGREGASA